MIVNQSIAISTSAVLLVPYEKSHVTTYHSWMKDAEIQEATASEALSLEEEYAMQKTWRNDADKLTFIVCEPLEELSTTRSKISSSVSTPEKMIGDVNLFLSPADEDAEGCIGELELMIAPASKRRRGYGRAAILTFLHYIQTHIVDILSEYKEMRKVEKMLLLQLKVKIGSKNVKSINLFESINFLNVGEGANYFGEVEFVFEGILGVERTSGLLDKFGVEKYQELAYFEDECDV
ncbi:hypothetical protein B7494_g7632 [Chlorociboria aeruginascens]|nr:hypothetical protein B7494_g7632 [Chlorociboria aeruginascens]